MFTIRFGTVPQKVTDADRLAGVCEDGRHHRIRWCDQHLCMRACEQDGWRIAESRHLVADDLVDQAVQTEQLRGRMALQDDSKENGFIDAGKISKPEDLRFGGVIRFQPRPFECGEIGFGQRFYARAQERCKIHSDKCKRMTKDTGPIQIQPGQCVECLSSQARACAEMYLPAPPGGRGCQTAFKRDPRLEWAPWAGQGHAADLTMSREFCCSNCAGLT